MDGGDAAVAGDATQESLRLVRDVGQIPGFSGAFKKDCTDLSRRVALLAHLLEEIGDFNGDLESLVASTSTSSTSTCLSDLTVALQSAKRLLSAAGNLDSKIISDGTVKKISFQFQCVTWKLEKALGNLPYNHLNISDEVQEQVELVRIQLRRATERYGGPLNSTILTRASSQPLDKEIDLLQSGRRVIGSLHIENVGNVDHEVKAKVDSVPKGNGSKGHNTEQLIHESERPRDSSASSGVCLPSDDAGSGVNSASKSLEENKKPDSPMIPDDFLCPISLELMRDPVIVATGQTYERSYIQRWIDCGNTSCPKTQQKLQNLTLTPNYVLRSLITQWCMNHNVEQPTTLTNGRIKKSDGSFRDVSRDMETIEALVHKLSSQSIEENRAAVAEIRSLSKRSTDNRILIAEAGAIPVLVNLLTTEDISTQENAVTSILNLSIYENNKGLIMLAGAVPSVVQVLKAGSMEARENAAATLFSLSLADENKIIIGAVWGNTGFSRIAPEWKHKREERCCNSTVQFVHLSGKQGQSCEGRDYYSIIEDAH
ncbi:hypothetical protein F0562_033442 [Nyssa sinensis]|uniref:RING-type E3 ubiquitin transferase n=1 Tax=Nyssa sinensis TaxID=561372 RepID=A0A5J5AET3_9ASTE|nr:hypothetical protein F0562_033442 [Nyssa sinensis]